MEEDGSVKLSSKTKSYVSRRLCCGVTVVLSLICTTLLFLMIMSLNGTLPALRDWNYIHSAAVPNQNEYAVVAQTMVQCRDDLPMRMYKVVMKPDPLVMPDAEFGNLELTYQMSLLADVPEDVSITAMIQRLSPPWQEVPCRDGSGSCKYENACGALTKIFGVEKCDQLKAGNHTRTVANLLVDLAGPFQWAVPGNYFAQVRVDYRDQAFGCVDLTFRIRDKP